MIECFRQGIGEDGGKIRIQQRQGRRPRQLHLRQIDQEMPSGRSFCHQLPDGGLHFLIRPPTAKLADPLVDADLLSPGPMSEQDGSNLVVGDKRLATGGSFLEYLLTR